MRTCLSLLAIDIIWMSLRGVHVSSACSPVPSRAQRRALICVGNRISMLASHHMRWRKGTTTTGGRSMCGVDNQLWWMGTSGRRRDARRSHRMHARRLVSKIRRVDRWRTSREMRAPSEMGCNFGQCVLDDILSLPNVCDVAFETPDTSVEHQQRRNEPKARLTLSLLHP